MSDSYGMIISQAVTAQGKEVTVCYDPLTTLTLVYDYVPGRSLIFEGDIVEKMVDGIIQDKTLAGCIVENHILGEMSVVDIWEDAKRRQKK